MHERFVRCDHLEMCYFLVISCFVFFPLLYGKYKSQAPVRMGFVFFNILMWHMSHLTILTQHI